MGKVAGILILDYKEVEPFRGPEVGKHSRNTINWYTAQYTNKSSTK
jgi:hypothetical protein